VSVRRDLNLKHPVQQLEQQLFGALYQLKEKARRLTQSKTFLIKVMQIDVFFKDVLKIKRYN
jgi:hypothetical protein